MKTLILTLVALMVVACGKEASVTASLSPIVGTWNFVSGPAGVSPSVKFIYLADNTCMLNVDPNAKLNDCSYQADVLKVTYKSGPNLGLTDTYAVTLSASNQLTLLLAGRPVSETTTFSR